MATMTLSTALAARITDKLTYRNASDSTHEATFLYQNFNNWESYSPAYRSNCNSLTPPTVGASLLAGYYQNTSQVYMRSSVMSFYSSANTLLVRYDTGTPGFNDLTRTIDADGYCVLSNFPQKTPVNNGTIDYAIITNNDTYGGYTLSPELSITLSVGNSGSGADIEIADRVVTTSQPWRLDGTFKFRVPISYTWST